MAALAVRGDVADDVEVGGDGGAAGPNEHLVLQDNGAWGAVQGRLRTTLPLDSTGSDGSSGILCFSRLKQRVLAGDRRQQKGYEQDYQSKSHLTVTSGLD